MLCTSVSGAARRDANSRAPPPSRCGPSRRAGCRPARPTASRSIPDCAASRINRHEMFGADPREPPQRHALALLRQIQIGDQGARRRNSARLKLPSPSSDRQAVMGRAARVRRRRNQTRDDGNGVSAGPSAFSSGARLSCASKPSGASNSRGVTRASSAAISTFAQSEPGTAGGHVGRGQGEIIAGPFHARPRPPAYWRRGLPAGNLR